LGVVDGTFVEVEVFDLVEIDGGVVIDDHRGLSITAAAATVFREVFVFDRGWCAVDLTQFFVVLHYGGHRIVHFGRVVGLRNGLVLVNVFVVFFCVLGKHLGDFGDGRAHQSVAVAKLFSDLKEHQQLVNGHALKPVVARLFELRQFLVGHIIR